MTQVIIETGNRIPIWPPSVFPNWKQFYLSRGLYMYNFIRHVGSHTRRRKI